MDELIILQVGLADSNGRELNAPGYGRLTCAFQRIGDGLLVNTHDLAWTPAADWHGLGRMLLFANGLLVGSGGAIHGCTGKSKRPLIIRAGTFLIEDTDDGDDFSREPGSPVSDLGFRD